MPAKTILAIGAHIGDMELTCGGVLASHARMGDRIVTLALTGGEKGNPPHLSVAAYRKQKEQEARAFAEMLNGQAIVLPYEDGQLPDDDEARFRVCDVIRQIRPDILLTHWQNSIHKDHEITHRIVRDAQFYAALPGFERTAPPHFASGPFYAENWEDPFGFTPTVYVTVTDEGFTLWREAIATHWFTVHSASFAYREYYTHLMSVRGIEARTSYAQAFDIPPMNRRQTLEHF